MLGPSFLWGVTCVSWRFSPWPQDWLCPLLDGTAGFVLAQSFVLEHWAVMLPGFWWIAYGGSQAICCGSVRLRPPRPRGPGHTLCSAPCTFWVLLSLDPLECHRYEHFWSEGFEELLQIWWLPFLYPFLPQVHLLWALDSILWPRVDKTRGFLLVQQLLWQGAGRGSFSWAATGAPHAAPSLFSSVCF